MRLFFTGIKLIFVLTGALFLFGCKKDKKLPSAPSIEFVSFIETGDSAYLTIKFVDGDADIGLREYDTVPPYDKDSRYYYNLFLDYYEWENNEWKYIELNPPFYYRIPYLTNQTNKNYLEGEITVTLAAPYYNPFSTASKYKYQIQLVDRALHESNVVETPELSK
jgi:hypothetical protein